MKARTFTAVIQDAGGGGAHVEIPFNVEKAFGSKKPKVKATIDGTPIAARWSGHLPPAPRNGRGVRQVQAWGQKATHC